MPGFFWREKKNMKNTQHRGSRSVSDDVAEVVDFDAIEESSGSPAKQHSDGMAQTQTKGSPTASGTGRPRCLPTPARNRVSRNGEQARAGINFSGTDAGSTAQSLSAKSYRESLRAAGEEAIRRSSMRSPTNAAEVAKATSSATLDGRHDCRHHSNEHRNGSAASWTPTASPMSLTDSNMSSGSMGIPPPPPPMDSHQMAAAMVAAGMMPPPPPPMPPSALLNDFGMPSMTMEEMMTAMQHTNVHGAMSMNTSSYGPSLFMEDLFPSQLILPPSPKAEDTAAPMKCISVDDMMSMVNPEGHQMDMEELAAQLRAAAPTCYAD